MYTRFGQRGSLSFLASKSAFDRRLKIAKYFSVGLSAIILTFTVSPDGFAATAELAALEGVSSSLTPGQVYFSGFPTTTSGFAIPPSLNSQGKVAFYAATSKFQVTNSTVNGIWSGPAGAQTAAAQVGEQVPGLPSGAVYVPFTSALSASAFSISGIPINNLGDVAFDAKIGGNTVTNTTDETISETFAGSLRITVRDGDSAAENPSTIKYGLSSGTTFSQPLMVGTDVGFAATLSNGGMGIYAGTSLLSQVAETGQQAPGVATGLTYAASFAGHPSIFFPSAMISGESVAFLAALSGTGATPQNAFGIWAGVPHSVHLVEQAGAQAPGMASGTTFQTFTSDTPFSFPDMNASSTVAFAGTVFTAAHMPSMGIWSGIANNQSLVIAEDAQAPGLPSGVTVKLEGPLGVPITTPALAPLISDHGDIAFLSALSGTGITSSNNTALWAGLPGNLHLIVQTGQQAPGTPDGTTFTSLVFPTSFATQTFSMNSSGHVAFLAQTSDGSIGIWGTDINGQLREVVRTGDTIEIAPGDTRTVVSLSFLGGSGGDDGRANGFNSTGQVAYWAQLTRGNQAILISNTLAAPEPASGLLVVIAGLAMVLIRRRL